MCWGLRTRLEAVVFSILRELMRKQFASALDCWALRSSSPSALVMLASRMARASLGALRRRVGSGSAARKGCTSELCCRPRPACRFPGWRWWLLPAALGLRLPGLARDPSTGTEKATPFTTGEEAAVEARSGQWGPRQAPPACMKTHGQSQICCQWRIGLAPVWAIWLLKKILILH